MHLRIYLWLSCVVVAGYVRATEEGIASTAAEPLQQDHQNEQPIASDRDLYVDDDEGSGLDRESSGSGWGPGVDDEDATARADGSGDDGFDAPPDDEDFSASTDAPRIPVTTTSTINITREQPTVEPEIVPFSFDDDVLQTSSRNLDPDSAGEGTAPEEPRVPAPERPEVDPINISGEDNTQTDQDLQGSNVGSETRPSDARDNVVFVMNAKPGDATTSFFAQPGILAAVTGGAVVGLLCAILVVMFVVYRMRKKDEGSYALDEPKRSPAAASYGKGQNNREFYA